MSCGEEVLKGEVGGELGFIPRKGLEKEGAGDKEEFFARAADRYIEPLIVLEKGVVLDLEDNTCYDRSSASSLHQLIFCPVQRRKIYMSISHSPISANRQSPSISESDQPPSERNAVNQILEISAAASLILGFAFRSPGLIKIGVAAAAFRLLEAVTHVDPPNTGRMLDSFRRQ